MKNKKLWLHLIFFFIIFALGITFFVLEITIFKSTSYWTKLIYSIIVSLLVGLMSSSLLINYFSSKRTREDIKDTFDYYVEKAVSSVGTGIVIFNKNDEIIWASHFMEERFGGKIIGKKISVFSKEFEKEFIKNKTFFRFSQNGFVFEVTVNIKRKLIIFKDVTNEDKILKQYISEKLVIGELEIDNFQQLQVTLSEEEIFSTQNSVLKVLDNLSEKYNFIYRQYVNGKYIFFTNKGVLNILTSNKFDFVEEIRKKKIENGYLSVSIGIGLGTSDQKQLQDLAREGLKQSHARGGDQISLMEFNKKPIYFGSQFELKQSMSRVKIRKIAKEFEQKLRTSNSKNVIVYGHKLKDLDALAAAIGIKALCEVYDKKVFIGNVTFDTTTEKVIKENFTPKEISEIFIKKGKAIKLTNQSTIVVVVDTSDINRIENNKAFSGAAKDNIFIFDHHRIQKQPENILQKNMYIDSNASSTAEIIVELISFVSRRIKLSRKTAQLILNGIFLDTSTFTKSVSSRTYSAASFLESQGASSSVSSNIMKKSEEASLFIKKILNNLEEIKPGYFLASYDAEEVPDDYISMAANEVLRTQGRKASFIVAKIAGDKNTYKMSTRGVETNVQKIAEQVGGGGHFSSSAAVSKEPLSIFLDNLRQAIVSEKEEE